MGMKKFCLSPHKLPCHFRREGIARPIAHKTTRIKTRVAQHGKGKLPVICLRMAGHRNDGAAMVLFDITPVIYHCISNAVDLRRK